MAKRRKKRTASNAILINKEQFGKLIEKLDILVKVTAASFRGEKLTEGIIFLSDLGFTAKEVAQILGTTDGYVGNVKSEAKKPKKKPETPEKEPTQEQETQKTAQ